MKVFITRIIPPIGLRLLEEAGIEYWQWTQKRELTKDELVSYSMESDAIISAGPNKIDKAFLNTCKHLKVISLLSVGYDNVDVPEAVRLGIPVGNTPGVLSGATADAAFLLMLAAARNAFQQHKKIAKGEWGFYEPTVGLGIELYGKTLGIFGLGKIGLEMAKRCIGAYAMKVIYHNRSRNEAAEQEVDARYVSFEELLRESDVLSVHTSLSVETKGRFDKTAFEQMKPSAIFVNSARGGIHNEDDLAAALNNRVIWGAGLDVTHPEPMDRNNPLLDMPNVAILPHIGSATVETRDAMAEIAARNAIAALKGEPLPFEVRE
jgi:glyoxylate reductase